MSLSKEITFVICIKIVLLIGIKQIFFNEPADCIFQCSKLEAHLLEINPATNTK